jgi:hypothetical protein
MWRVKTENTIVTFSQILLQASRWRVKTANTILQIPWRKDKSYANTPIWSTNSANSHCKAWIWDQTVMVDYVIKHNMRQSSVKHSQVIIESHLEQSWSIIPPMQMSFILVELQLYCYIKRTTDNALHIFLQASRWRVKTENTIVTFSQILLQLYWKTTSIFNKSLNN